MSVRAIRGHLVAGLLAVFLPALPALSQKLTGFAELEGFGYDTRVTEREPWVLGWARLFLKEEASIGPLRIVGSLRAEKISSTEAGPLAFDPADRNERRSPLSVRELWIRIPATRAVDIQLGRFELGWGKTDGYSPADAFLPRDATDPYADEKLPIWGARVQGQRGSFRFELLGAATTTPWRLPVLEGRNAPITVPAGAPFERVFLTEGESHPPTEGFGVARILLNSGAWDAGVWGRAGVRPAPLLSFRLDQARLTPDGVAVPVDRRWVREEGLGFELSRVMGGFVLRAEGAALFSRDPELSDALIWTVGVERTFGDGSLVVTLAANVRGTLVDPALLFDRALLPGVIAAYTRTERWGSWRVVALHAFRHGDGLVKAEVEDAVTDVWRVALGVDLPYGSRRGPFGARSATRRAHLAVRRSW